MGDAENAVSLSKKRVAGRQLSRDDDPDAEEDDICGQETKSFQRASEEVLATRRIVRVRRAQSSSSEAPNPFAAIKLVPPVALQAGEACNATDGFTNDSEKTEETGAPEGTELAEEKSDKNKELIRESTDSKSEEPNTEEPSKDESNKEEGEEDEEKLKKDTPERKLPTAVKIFQQLSSAQNAFTGIAGTGFSTSCFSFDTKIMPYGSTPKFGSFCTGSAFGSPSSFGSLSGTGSLFGVKPGGDELSLSGTPGNTNNGAVAFQLFEAPLAENNSASRVGFGALQETPLETGEEKEKAVFTADAALFQYIDGGWKERGKGELRLNIPTADTGRARLVMRARGNYRLILNTNLYPDMKLAGMEKRGVTFACFNNAGEVKEGLATFALKFKDSSVVDDFRAAVEAHKGRSSAEIKTSEASPKTG
eukprot:Gb_12922 [translate_table: standard]